MHIILWNITSNCNSYAIIIHTLLLLIIIHIHSLLIIMIEVVCKTELPSR